MEDPLVTIKDSERSQQPRNAGLSAWRLYAPVAALVLFAVALAGGALWLAVVEIDKTVAKSSSRLAITAIEDITTDFGILAKDYAYWDVTVEFARTRSDTDWADENLGSYLADTFGTSAAIVTDGGDEVVYTWLHPERAAPTAQEAGAIVADLSHAIGQARGTELGDPKGFPCLVRTSAGLAVAGVSAITAEDLGEAERLGRPRPLLIVLRQLDEQWLMKTGERFGLDNMRVLFDPDKASEHAVTLYRSDGSRIAALDWDTRQAGLEALRELSVPAFVLLVLALAAGAVVISRAIQAQQALVSRARDLSEVNTDLVNRDQQVRSALQRAEHATRAKSAFLARISHEIRTPLTAIIGFSQILKLQHRPGSEKTREQEYAEIIHESSQHLLALVNDLLDLSKIESGGFEINEHWVDVAREIGSIRTVLGVEAERKGVTLSVELPDDVPALYADSKAIRQILTNLVSNALKFTPRGGRTVVRLRVEADGALVVAVADTGAGIAPEDQQTIWEPFTRARNPALAQAEGTGLGLYLVKMLAQLHGADVRLESELGEGTVVSVVFGPERVRAVAA